MFLEPHTSICNFCGYLEEIMVPNVSVSVVFGHDGNYVFAPALYGLTLKLFLFLFLAAATMRLPRKGEFLEEERNPSFVFKRS